MRSLPSLALSAAALSALPIQAAKAEPFDVSGSARVRWEWIEGQPRVGFAPRSDLVNLRTRLLATGDLGGVGFGAELFDSRVYDGSANDPISTNEVNAAELVQLYVTAEGRLAGLGVSAQAGRMLLNIGSRRLIAADDFRNTTNGYTGLKLDLRTKGGVEATFAWAMPQQIQPDTRPGLDDAVIERDRESLDAQLTAAFVTFPTPVTGARVQPSVVLFREQDGRRATRDRRLDNFGLRVFRPARAGLDFDVEGVLQRGEASPSAASTAARQEVEAWFGRAQVGWRFEKAPWTPRLSFEYDHASGDEPGARIERFDTLFGFRRAEIGPSGLYNSVGRANFAGPTVRIEFAPTRASDFMVTYRPLRLASKTDAFSTTGVRDPSGGSGGFAGDQIDVRGRHWFMRDRLRGEATLVRLHKGGFLTDAPNAPRNGDTTYVTIDLTAFF